MHPGSQARHGQLHRIAVTSRFMWNRILASSSLNEREHAAPLAQFPQARELTGTPSVTFLVIGKWFAKLHNGQVDDSGGRQETWTCTTR